MALLLLVAWDFAPSAFDTTKGESWRLAVQLAIASIGLAATWKWKVHPGLTILAASVAGIVTRL